jgi:hypothetical protein
VCIEVPFDETGDESDATVGSHRADSTSPLPSEVLSRTDEIRVIEPQRQAVSLVMGKYPAGAALVRNVLHLRVVLCCSRHIWVHQLCRSEIPRGAAGLLGTGCFVVAAPIASRLLGGRVLCLGHALQAGHGGLVDASVAGAARR